MDFFESQHQARRRTGRLLALYVLAVAAMVISIYVVILLLADAGGMELRRTHPLWHAELFLAVSGVTLLLVGIGSAYRIIQLRSGGSTVARMLGGRQVSPNTTDPDERKFVNIVEEMAIASGVPVPEIFVLENETGINAFAAGYSPSDAAVAVTKACMQQLTRDELQGVIAHEFAHILNGDMRLNIRLIGVLNGILLLHLIGYMVVRSLRFSTAGRSRRSGNDKGGGAIFFILALGFALMIIGYVGVFFSRLIQAAVSRQREYLADAAAVQFTRNPDGIAGALKKIGGSSMGGRISASHAMEASHLFFANGIVSSLSNVFATHPPLVKRIRAIDPSFDGKSWTVPKRRTPPPASSGTPRPPPLPKQPFDPVTKAMPMSGAALLATIGTLESENISRAERLLAKIPADIREAVRDPVGAEAVVYALILGDDPELLERQYRIIENRSLEAVAVETKKRYASMRSLPPEVRLPLADLALPALRQLSPLQFDRFRQAVGDLIASDQKLALFEFALEKMIMRHLELYFLEARRPTVQFYSASGLLPELSVLLSALSHAGEKDTRRAFGAGIQRLPGMTDRLQLLPEERCSLDAVAKALDQFGLAAYPVKKQLLDAAIAVIISDGKVVAEEAELLRAIADTLDCPMPPLA